MTGLSYPRWERIVRELDEEALAKGATLFSAQVAETWTKIRGYSHLARVIDARANGRSIQSNRQRPNHT